jgi:hypothetical protein
LLGQQDDHFLFSRIENHARAAAFRFLYIDPDEAVFGAVVDILGRSFTGIDFEINATFEVGGEQCGRRGQRAGDETEKEFFHVISIF